MLLFFFFNPKNGWKKTMGSIKTWVDYGKFQLTTGKFYGDIEKDKGHYKNPEIY